MFFLKDKIDKGELDIKHCPTDEMIADYFTKPLQGSKFRAFRDIMIGVKSNHYETQEHVGK